MKTRIDWQFFWFRRIVITRSIQSYIARSWRARLTRLSKVSNTQQRCLCIALQNYFISLSLTVIKSKPVKRQDFPAQTPVLPFRGPAFVLLPSSLDQPALRERETASCVKSTSGGRVGNDERLSHHLVWCPRSWAHCYRSPFALRIFWQIVIYPRSQRGNFEASLQVLFLPLSTQPGATGHQITFYQWTFESKCSRRCLLVTSLWMVFAKLSFPVSTIH